MKQYLVRINNYNVLGYYSLIARYIRRNRRGRVNERHAKRRFFTWTLLIEI